MSEYSRNFSKASENSISDHVVKVNEMVEMGSGAMRKSATVSHHFTLDKGQGYE